MVFGWLYRRVAKGVVSALNEPQQTKGRRKQPPKVEENLEDTEIEPTYPLGETGGRTDPIAEVYREAMEEARANRDYKTAADMARKLDRRIRGVEGGRPRSDEAPEETSESLISNSGAIDLNNLAPHADSIAKELVGWLSGAGVLPEGLSDSAVGVLAGQIKAHPELVKTGLDTLSGVLNKYAGKATGKVQGLTVTGGLDPAHPEQWAAQMGYGK